jgi:hypothetical protein
LFLLSEPLSILDVYCQVRKDTNFKRVVQAKETFPFFILLIWLCVNNLVHLFRVTEIVSYCATSGFTLYHIVPPVASHYIILCHQWLHIVSYCATSGFKLYHIVPPVASHCITLCHQWLHIVSYCATSGFTWTASVV